MIVFITYAKQVDLEKSFLGKGEVEWWRLVQGGNRRETPKDSFDFRRRLMQEISLKSQWCDLQQTQGCYDKCGSPIFSKNLLILQQFFTNLFLEFLLFSVLVPNQARLACKHWQRWARRTNFSPFEKEHAMQVTRHHPWHPFFFCMLGIGQN